MLKINFSQFVHLYPFQTPILLLLQEYENKELHKR